MTVKHTPTPGPWRYSDEELWGAVYGSSHELVATVLPGILDKSKVVATARLISAAPEMLLALKALLASHYMYHQDGGASDIEAQALAAIKLAEGEAP